MCGWFYTCPCERIVFFVIYFSPTQPTFFFASRLKNKSNQKDLKKSRSDWDSKLGLWMLPYFLLLTLNDVLMFHVIAWACPPTQMLICFSHKQLSCGSGGRNILDRKSLSKQPFNLLDSIKSQQTKGVDYKIWHIIIRQAHLHIPCLWI